MTAIEEVYPGSVATSKYLAWTPAVAGALIATALSATLVAFGGWIGRCVLRADLARRVGGALAVVRYLSDIGVAGQFRTRRLYRRPHPNRRVRHRLR
jgi:hypothetical protein